VFHGIGKDDVEQHWFMCEAIWSVKRIIDEATKVVQARNHVQGQSLDVVHEVQGHYMPMGQARSLTEIKKDIT
jgi:hypothetical protein